MTSAEYVEFWRDFAAKFPDTGRWVLDPERRATLRAWFDATFQHLDFRQCVAVTSEFCGQGLPPYARENLPALWRARVAEISARQCRRQRAACDLHAEQQRARQEIAPGMLWVLREATRLPLAHRRRYIAELFACGQQISAVEWAQMQPEQIFSN